MKHQCECCKVRFGYTPFGMEKGNKVFCSRSCWEEWHKPNGVPQLQVSQSPSYFYYRGNRILRH